MNKLPKYAQLSPISRRTVLKLFSVGTASGLLGYSRFSKPQPTVFQPDVLELPQQLDKPSSVVVVGAGLAGLACAYELSQRGFAVTLLEKSPLLGGKIASWQINVGDEAFKMEHGFHGFFPQYYNLNGLVAELDIKANFRSLNRYSVLYQDKKYQPEVFRPTSSAFPWNMVDLAVASPNLLSWGINLTKLKHLQVFQAITGFQMQKSFARLDRISVADWIETDFPQGLYDLYFLPFAKSSLNAPDLMSVGELMQFFHFYFFGNPEGLAFNGTCDDMGTSLVQPIAEAIALKGGKIVTGATVDKISVSKGKIDFLSYQQGEASDRVPFWVERNNATSDYGAGDRVFATIADTSEVVSLTCTHQGCTVAIAADGNFHCPCHGAVFNREGKVLKGPADKDLPRYQVVQNHTDKLQLVSTVPLPLQTPETIKADYYVFATDVPGVKQLFNCTTGEVDSIVRSQVEKLAVADPFAVCRFWFDADFDWQHSHFTSLSGYKLTDSITLYHRIQDQFIDWAKRTGGSVVELHAYCYKEKDFPTQQTLLTTFKQELYEIVPSLKQANILHQEIVNQKNFAGYPPNSYASRPETNTEIANLLFAGDWVKMPFPSGLMERAVSSGLLAANEILHRQGLQRRSLFSVNPQGLFNI